MLLNPKTGHGYGRKVGKICCCQQNLYPKLVSFTIFLIFCCFFAPNFKD